MGPIERAIRRHATAGDELRTPSREAPFTVSKIDERGVELLLGEKEAQTRLSWDCLEGVPDYLAGRDWVRIGSLYDIGAEPGTLDAYLTQHIKRATAGWVAALLEEAGVVNIDGSRPAYVRLNAAFREQHPTSRHDEDVALVPAPPREEPVDVRFRPHQGRRPNPSMSPSASSGNRRGLCASMLAGSCSRRCLLLRGCIGCR